MIFSLRVDVKRPMKFFVFSFLDAIPVTYLASKPNGRTISITQSRSIYRRIFALYSSYKCQVC